MASTPNLNKLGAVIQAIGKDASVSWQARSTEGGFFTVTYYPHPSTRCAIGQGDTLPEAVEAARRDAAQLAADCSVADLEKVAA